VKQAGAAPAGKHWRINNASAPAASGALKPDPNAAKGRLGFRQRAEEPLPAPLDVNAIANPLSAA
jgi:hypothetical protein